MVHLEYTLVDPEMVWLSYKENGDKHVKELVGKEAVQFLKFISDAEQKEKSVLDSSGPWADALPENSVVQLKSDDNRSDS